MATYTHRFTPATGNDPDISLFHVVERPLYGSSRLGVDAQEVDLATATPTAPTTAHPGQWRYELTDHLGNVQAVVTEELLGLDGNNDQSVDQWAPVLLSAQDYEPFGALLPGRNYSSDAYRFGFQGQEKDDEINDGVGTSYAFKYRLHDPRVGRFLSIDPLASKYPHNSPYAFSENRLIDGIEFEGIEVVLLFGGGVGSINDDLSPTLIQMQTDLQTYSDAKGLGAKVQAFGDDLPGAAKWFNENYELGEPIILYGYSAGAGRANHLAGLLGAEGFKVDRMITIDPALGVLSGPLEIPSNVDEVWNYYQTERSTFPILSRGYPAVPAEGNTNTTIINTNLDDRKSATGSKAHGAMAGDTYHNDTNLIKNELHEQNYTKLIAE